MSPENTDLLFTISASLSLLVLFVTAALVLPWTEEELDEVEVALRCIAGQKPALASSIESVPSTSATGFPPRSRRSGSERT